MEVENLRNAMSLAFEHVWAGVGDVCSGFTGQGVWFSLKKDNTFNSGPVENNSTSIANLFNGQLDPPRALDPAGARLAYLLGEFALLLLKTPWVLGICGCRLRQMRLLQREEYLIIPFFNSIPATGDEIPLNNNPPAQDFVPSPDCWCNDNLPLTERGIFHILGYSWQKSPLENG